MKIHISFSPMNTNIHTNSPSELGMPQGAACSKRSLPSSLQDSFANYEWIWGPECVVKNSKPQAHTTTRKSFFFNRPEEIPTTCGAQIWFWRRQIFTFLFFLSFSLQRKEAFCILAEHESCACMHSHKMWQWNGHSKHCLAQQPQDAWVMHESAQLQNPY